MELKYIIKRFDDEDSEIVCKIHVGKAVPPAAKGVVIIDVDSWFFKLNYEVSEDDYEYLFHYMKKDFELHTMKLYRFIGHEKCADYLSILESITYKVTDIIDEMF